MVKDYRECKDALRQLRRTLPVDRVILACSCDWEGCFQALVIRDPAPDAPVTLATCETGPAFQQVILTNRSLKISGQRFLPGVRDRGSLLRKEDQRAFISVPVCDPCGTPIACLSLTTRLPRIWSRCEEEDLAFVAAMLRSMLFDAPSDSWHTAITRGCNP